MQKLFGDSSVDFRVAILGRKLLIFGSMYGQKLLDGQFFESFLEMGSKSLPKREFYTSKSVSVLSWKEFDHSSSWESPGLESRK